MRHPDVIMTNMASALTQWVTRHMAMSKGHIARQRKFAAGLVRDGHEASQALALLLRFEELQQLHIADRDRLRGQLGE